MTLGDFLSLEYPLVQAPMAGGACTPELIAAVSNGGGLGSLAAGMLPASAIEQQIRQIRARTSKSFAVNLMVLTQQHASDFTVPVPKWLEDCYHQQNIKIQLPQMPAESFSEQLQVLLDHPVPVVSFTFGVIRSTQVEALHQVGSKVIGTANHPREAKAWADIGADAVCVQGVEAGGHRGGWLLESEQDPLGLLTLISQTKAITDIPLIAAGGLMTGHDINAVLCAGAELAQLGTAFLTTHESGISQTYRRALLQASCGERSDLTCVTRLFSGKPARGLVNAFIKTYAEFDNAQLPPYPQLNAMTQSLRNHANTKGNTEFLSLWAGQGVSRVAEESVKTLMQRIASQLNGSGAA